MLHAMTVAMLTQEPIFPDPSGATGDGLVAIGGDLSVQRLRAAYREGVFPWPISGLRILTWFSPDPRLVLPLHPIRLSRTVRRAVARSHLRLTFDHAFADVLHTCARIPRHGTTDTWITPIMRHAYQSLHAAGDAHSVEAWDGNTLVAGLYGVAVGGVFSAESMFHLKADASKVVVAGLMCTLQDAGFELIDAQVPSPHLERYGAEEWPRARFLTTLRRERERMPWPAGSWRDRAVRLDR